MSRRNPDGTCHPARDYSPTERKEAFHILARVLDGIGDKRWMRSFRMCITQCLHKGLSDGEIARLPREWHEMEARDIAGAPIEIFWSRGVPADCITALPCDNPGKHHVDVERDIYFPIDCGKCASCQARAAIPARCSGPACPA